MTCRQLAKELTGYEWNLGKIIRLSAEDFLTWVNTDTTGYDGHDYLDQDKFVDSERDLWLELGK